MRILLVFTLLIFASALFAQKVELKNKVDSASYAYGVAIGDNLKQQLPEELNPDILLNAMRDAYEGKETVFNVQEAQQIFTNYMNEQQTAQAAAGKAEGDAFLANNKKRPEVKTTESGLQYEILKKGEGGLSPAATDKVKVHYHGTNIDGSVFDSSVDRGEPISFELNRVIKGWTEGLQLMQVGDKYKFYIPSELAYGERSPSPNIKPNAVLIFEVELLGIEGK